MDGDTGLDELQAAYQAAVAAWIEAIRAEAALAAVDHSVAKLDTWEAAAFAAGDAGDAARDAKAAYEDALRERLFGI